MRDLMDLKRDGDRGSGSMGNFGETNNIKSGSVGK